MGLIDSIVGAESGGDPNAKNPNSSATGAGQFIDSTWLDVISRARPDLVQGKTPEQILAMRSDPQLSREMTQAYADQNSAVLSKNGLPVTPGSTYLAHFAGPQGAVSVLQADPSAPVSSVLRPDAINANPFLKNMTVADLRAWADRKMGGAAPQAASLQPAPATPAASLSSALNVGGSNQTATLRQSDLPPIFPPQSAPQQQAPQAEAPQGLFSEMQPPAQMPPIFFPQRHAPDLAKLRAAFKAPVFSRG